MNYISYLKYGVLCLFVIALGIPIFPEMFDIWINDPDNSHGILVPFVSIFLVYRLKDTITMEMIRPYGPGIILLVISLILFVLSIAGEVSLFARITYLTALISLILLNFGPDVIKRLYFPLGYLFFMIPIPVALYYMVAFPLQLFASKVSANLIHIIGIPVIREGNVLHLTGGSLAVVEACSGIRSLVSYITIGVFFVYLSRISIIKKGFLLCSTVPLAITANILRVFSSCILAHFYGLKVAKGFLHEFSGIVIFMLGIFMILLLNSILGRISFATKVAD